LKSEFGEYHLGWCGKMSHPGKQTKKVIHNEFTNVLNSHIIDVAIGVL